MHVLTFCRIAGIFPLVRRGTAFAISWPWLLYSTILAIANTYIQNSFLMQENSVTGVTALFKTTTIFQRLYTVACILTCLYYITKNRRNLSKYSLVLSSLSTAKISGGLNTRDDSKYASCLLPYFLFCASFDAAQENSVWEIFTTAVAQFLAHFPVICIVRHFVYFVDQVNSKLKGLVDDLTALEEFANYNLVVSDKSAPLLLMCDVHYTISVAAGYLNSAYTYQYFTLVSGAVCVLIVNFYKATTFLSDSDFLQASQVVCWTAFWLILLATVILPPARASRMSSEFNIQLSQLIAQRQNITFEAIHNEPAINKLRVHVDFDYTVKFSCGFFELNRFLIHSILGGICSFSVILVQISPRSDSKTQHI